VKFSDAAGFEPYPWQKRLAAHPWAEAPEVGVDFPTGTGKLASAVVPWLMEIANGQNPPSRLVLIQPMRTLVDQAIKSARGWIKNAGLDISVYCLKGGQVDRGWQYPGFQILVGTQDQILSRQLNRGYGASRALWPLEAGLLNNDVRLVFDELQLMGVGYSTAQRLSAFRALLGAYKVQCLWMSATFDTHLDIPLYSLTEQEQISLPKLTRKKALKRVQAASIGPIVEENLGQGLILVVRNTVEAAIQVYEELESLTHNIGLLHGRMRGCDRKPILDALPSFDVVVSTQVIEAGVDIDARVLVTDLCPRNSLIQRAGRLGRNDTYEDALLYVVEDGPAGPYRDTDGKPTGSWKTLERLKQLNFLNWPTILSELGFDTYSEPSTLQLSDLETLFVTQGSDADLTVSKWVQDSGPVYPQLAWVEALPNSPEEIHQDLLVRAGYSGKGYFWDGEKWVLGGQPQPGQLWVLLAEWGGYSDRLGVTGKAEDVPTIPHLPKPKPMRQLELRGCGLVTLSQHSREVRDWAAQLTDLSAVVRAALWHDLGKAHPVQQTWFGVEQPGVWAKSDQEGLGRKVRPGFRHEVASLALAIAKGLSPLEQYLIVAHHGVVRTELTPLAGEPAGQVRGVVKGERLGTVALELPSALRWRRLCHELYEEHQFFRLLYMEALVRVADWAASAGIRVEPDS
jgi:CRISPR-associated endonuclease/helicase Cas3